MMEDMISKEKLLESFHDIRWKTVNNKRAQTPVTEIYVPWVDVAKRIIKQPTVEAIPVERVARMFAEFTEHVPCGYGFDDDDWCEENCSNHENKDCWLRALKEGWLDEE